MHKNALEMIMSESVVDERRIELMSASGAGNEAVSYHTAYGWSKAVDEEIGILEKQKKMLKEMHHNLYCYREVQGCIEGAIMQIEKAIDREYKVVGRFWAEQPEDFER